jgi:hypothetical protein
VVDVSIHYCPLSTIVCPPMRNESYRLSTKIVTTLELGSGTAAATILTEAGSGSGSFVVVAWMLSLSISEILLAERRALFRVLICV